MKKRCFRYSDGIYPNFLALGYTGIAYTGGILLILSSQLKSLRRLSRGGGRIRDVSIVSANIRTPILTCSRVNTRG